MANIVQFYSFLIQVETKKKYYLNFCLSASKGHRPHLPYFYQFQCHYPLITYLNHPVIYVQKSSTGKIFTAAFFIVYLQEAYKQGRFGSGLLSGWPTPSIFVRMINFALLTYYNSCFLTYCMDFNVRPIISICTFFHMDILPFRLFTISIAMAKLLNFGHVSTCFDTFRHISTRFDLFRHNPIT